MGFISLTFILEAELVVLTELLLREVKIALRCFLILWEICHLIHPIMIATHLLREHHSSRHRLIIQN